MIDLTRVREVLSEALSIVDDLDGLALDESDAVASQSKSKARQVKAQRSQDLQLLATRFELAASLTRIEYWYARGENDPLTPDRNNPRRNDTVNA